MKKLNGMKWLVLLLCLVLAVTALVACGGDDPAETTDGGETTGGTAASNKVADFAVIYPASSAEAKAAAEALAAAATDKLGASFKAVEADGDSYNPQAPEILVGATNRPDSAAVLSELGGASGYVVKKTEYKVAINASSAELLDEAVQYFITNCVETGASGEMKIASDLLYVGKSSGVTVFNEKGEMIATIVYGKDIDTTSGSDKYDRTDYVVKSFLELNEQFMTGYGVETVNFETDKKPASSNEILLGVTSREETEIFRNSLKINEYGYGVVGDKIVVTGWSDYTIGKAVELFMKDLKNYEVTEGGVTNLLFKEGDKVVKTYDLWNVDIPLYNAGKLSGVVELLNDSYQAYYTDTTLEEYNAYCEDLVTNQGYQRYQKNQIANNHYGTFTNGHTMIHVYYVDYLKAVRFITESMSTVVLPQNSDPYEKITDTVFTTYDFYTASGNWGNCFIITLEDGSFILHDGGATDSNHDIDELHTLLQSLNKREDGKIVIAGWIISHQHYDHFWNAYKMVEKYYKEDVTVEKLIFNVPTESVDYNSKNPGSYYEGGNFHRLQLWMGTDLIYMHSGQTIQLRNLKVELIYSPDDVYPRGLEKFNNTAFVTRFDVGEGENKQRYMIVGDAEEVACDIMVKMHGDALKCDMVTVAHHGSGGSVELYAHCLPKIVIWPHTQERVNSELASGASGYYPTINKSLCNQKNVVLLIASDYGHRTIPLPLIGLTNNRSENMKNFVTVQPRFDGSKN